ncbi:hypothetical protein V2J09_006374 [Rumex salicifolius]
MTTAWSQDRRLTKAPGVCSAFVLRLVPPQSYQVCVSPGGGVVLVSLLAALVHLRPRFAVSRFCSFGWSLGQSWGSWLGSVLLGCGLAEWWWVCPVSLPATQGDAVAWHVPKSDGVVGVDYVGNATKKGLDTDRLTEWMGVPGVVGTRTPIAWYRLWKDGKVADIEYETVPVVDEGSMTGEEEDLASVHSDEAGVMLMGDEDPPSTPARDNVLTVLAKDLVPPLAASSLAAPPKDVAPMCNQVEPSVSTPTRDAHLDGTKKVPASNVIPSTCPDPIRSHGMDVGTSTPAKDGCDVGNIIHAVHNFGSLGSTDEDRNIDDLETDCQSMDNEVVLPSSSLMKIKCKTKEKMEAYGGKDVVVGI